MEDQVYTLTYSFDTEESLREFEKQADAAYEQVTGIKLPEEAELREPDDAADDESDGGPLGESGGW